MFNLLEDQFINVTASGRANAANLPEVNVGKMAGTADALPAPRPNQRHARYSFLIQRILLSGSCHSRSGLV